MMQAYDPLARERILGREHPFCIRQALVHLDKLITMFKQ